jgi:hypothetical protein
VLFETKYSARAFVVELIICNHSAPTSQTGVTVGSKVTGSRSTLSVRGTVSPPATNPSPVVPQAPPNIFLADARPEHGVNRCFVSTSCEGHNALLWFPGWNACCSSSLASFAASFFKRRRLPCALSSYSH